MTDKEKIHNEVEKCYSEALERAKITDADYWRGKADAYGNVLIQLESMQEEPVSEDLEKVVEEIVDPTVLNAYGVKEIANRLRRTMIEPVSKDLEEAAIENMLKGS